MNLDTRERSIIQFCHRVGLRQINADEHRFLDEQVRFGIFKSEKDTLLPFIGQNQCLHLHLQQVQVSVFICD